MKIRRETKKSSQHGIKEGVVFEIPATDGCRGYGQVIVGGKVFYIAVFCDLYRDRPVLEKLLKDCNVLLVGWTVDALIYHGQWKVIGHSAPICARIPFPSYKVRINGQPCIHDFDGSHRRPASTAEWELLEHKTTVAPIRYQNALLAFHGIGEWKSEYEIITFEHVNRRVLKGNDVTAAIEYQH